MNEKNLEKKLEKVSGGKGPEHPVPPEPLKSPKHGGAYKKLVGNLVKGLHQVEKPLE